MSGLPSDPGASLQPAPAGTHVIAGVPTGIAAFLGRALAGPTDGPVSIFSFGDYQEIFGGLSGDSPMSYAVSDFFANGGAQAVIVRFLSASPSAGETQQGAGGPIRDCYAGDLQQQTGIYALEKADLFNILCVPPDDLSQPDGGVPASFWTEAAAYCQKRRAMLIVEPPQSWADHANKGEWSQIQPSDLGISEAQGDNAAVYFPRVYAPDPLNSGVERLSSACGMIAGVWAATDRSRGVWKAPAGMVAALAGVSRLEIVMLDADNEVLNPLGINCLRDLPVYGPLLWGARTLSGADALGSQFKYIPVRRLTLFLEESLYRGTTWTTFEPNDESLWAELRLQVETFFQALYLQGALAGSEPSVGYFVRCDATTTTQTDIARGVVNIVVGFAPLEPAEFVILEIAALAAC